MHRLIILQKWSIFLWGVGIFLLFVGFSYLVHKNLFVHLDFDTTVRLQEHISRRFDSFFSFLSDVGKFEIVTSILLAITGWYVIAYKKWLAGIMAFFFYGSMHLVEIYGKVFVHHLPPPHFMLRTHDVFTFPEFYVQQTNSYPSGHAGRALFFSVFVGFLVGKNKRLSKTQKMFVYLFFTLYDIVMLTSRIYLGEHWLSDVIGGTILGTACGLFASVLLF